MKRGLPFILIASVAVVTLLTGVILYRAKKIPIAQSFATGDFGAVPPQARGNAAAPVTIEEFGDLQCPPCALFSAILHRLGDEYHGRLRLVFRQFPLQMHRHARAAAELAEAAGMQGKFWEMHDLLYRNQEVWSAVANPQELFSGYASSLGLDLPRVQKDAQDPNVSARIDADQKRGLSLGVNGTPAVFLNGRSIPFTSFNEPALRAIIEAALRGETIPVTSPTPTPL